MRKVDSLHTLTEVTQTIVLQSTANELTTRCDEMAAKNGAPV